MRNPCIPVCALILSVLAGCASVETSTPTEGTPANWNRFLGFNNLGLSIEENAPSLVTGPAVMVLSSKQDLDIVVQYVDSETKKKYAQLNTVKDGDRYRIDLFFESSGTYDVSIVGRPAGSKDTQYELVAYTTLTARVNPDAPLVYPALARHGVALVSPPDQIVREQTRIALTTKKGLTVSYSLQDKSTGDYRNDMVDIENTKTGFDIVVSFPRSGDYLLIVYGKDKKEDPSPGDTLLKVPFTATVDPSLVEVLPAGWKPGPGYRKYDVKVTSTPDAPVADSATLLFSMKGDVSLSYGYRNKTTDKDSRALPDVLDYSVDKGQARVDLSFSETGTWDIWLWGQAKGESDSILIATVTIKATVKDRTGLVPDNWTVKPRFWSYGITLGSSSPRVTGETLDLLLRPPADVKVSAIMRKKGTNEYARMIGTVEEGRDRRIIAVFPESAEYELLLSAQKEGDKYTREIATVSFAATVDKSVTKYRMWRIDNGWPLLPIEKVEDVRGAWKPMGEWESSDIHQKAVLREDFVIPVGEDKLTLRKGSPVELAMDDKKSQITTLVFALPRDYQQKLGDQTVTFKAGSSLALQQWGLVGTVTRDQKLALDAGEIALPKGSRMVLYNDYLQFIELSGKATYTHDKKTYECADKVLIDMFCFEDTPNQVRITTTKTLPMKFGTAKFALPAGSQIAFAKDRIGHLVFVQDTEITIDGKKDTVPAGWGLQLNTDGVVEKYKIE